MVYVSTRARMYADYTNLTFTAYIHTYIHTYIHNLFKMHLRASLCKILISSFANKMDFAHNFSVDFV